ncbi:MAG: DUF4105 domain-containing protein [Bacteroidia bacterium]|nr:DUF4105 domain-containing protein [Bacteroidia bacterium]
MKRFILAFLTIFPAGMFAAAPKLSPEAQISLLTCQPGEELYSSFGHSAIRISDPQTGLDVVFNYGTFDFQTPNFYLKFMRGQLNYKLDTDPWREFDYAYRYFKRTFDEQVFNLTLEQKQAVFDYLDKNYQPENRFYLYDFFFDNCATRISDVFIDVLGDSLKFDPGYTDTDKTFRDLIGEYLQGKAWTDFGIDLALGRVIDRAATPREQAFLPDYLAKYLGAATIVRDGKEQPFVVSDNRLYDSGVVYPPTPFWLRPGVFFWPLLLLIGFLTWREYKAGKRRKWLDVTIFLIYGLAGVLIALLWFATDHTATANNLNILWLLPTHLLAGFLLIPANKPTWLKYYFLGSAILAALVILGWFFLGQAFHPASLPLVGIVMVRSLWVGLNGV